MNAEPDTLEVYVPAEGSPLYEKIAPGSGIVGSEVGDTGRLRIDFEGNLYDLDELRRYADRVARAAERHLWRGENGERYQTVACAYVDADQVIAVGSFRPTEGALSESDRNRLRRWLQVDEVSGEELIPSG